MVRPIGNWTRWRKGPEAKLASLFRRNQSGYTGHSVLGVAHGMPTETIMTAPRLLSILGLGMCCVSLLAATVDEIDILGSSIGHCPISMPEARQN